MEEEEEEGYLIKRLRVFFWLWSMASVMRASWGEGCSEAEKASLLKIRDSINDPNGGALTQWVRHHRDSGNASIGCCLWPGVSCSSGTVAGINITNKREPKLGTWFPDATLFASFPQLTKLVLDGNQIGGWNSSQAFSRLQRLQYLSLEDNRLTNNAFVLQDLCMLRRLYALNLGKNKLNDSQIPLCLENMSSLQTLDLHGNNLSNPVAIKGLCGLERLQTLNLRENLLVDFPPCFANLSMVRYFDVSNNCLGGKIPSDILGSLYLLENLDLSYNRYTDEIPIFLANKSMLTNIRLSHNSLSKSIPGWLLDGNILQNLWHLSLSNNNFNGSFPIPSNPSKTLYQLDLSNNQIEGTIPGWLLDGNIVQNLSHLCLSNNNFNGSFPIPPNPSKTLYQLDLSNNKIGGTIPHDLTTLFPNLNNFSMSSNDLEGNILPTFCNNNLSDLDLSNNRFSGELPYTLFLDCTNLEVIKLSNNNLQGVRAPYDFRPSLRPSLHTLDIGKNNFSGGFGSWLDAVPNLQVLVMRNNRFDGPIPVQLCQMQSLRIVDVSHNKLTGQIPRCLYNITSWAIQIAGDEDYQREKGRLHGESEELTTKGGLRPYSGTPLSMITVLDLSMNSLNGPIPLELAKLGRLRSLDLSNNDLSGPIPSDFKSLRDLESLDLSHNCLTGMIPPELTQLNSLAFFSVAANNLSGIIPQGGHSDTFDRDSYIGNRYLCGKPLETPCETPSGVDNPTLHAKEVLGEFDFVLYTIVLTSFILGFWGFMGPLYLSQSWRENYFEAVDSCIHFCYYRNPLSELMNRNGWRLLRAQEQGEFQMTVTANWKRDSAQ